MRHWRAVLVIGGLLFFTLIAAYVISRSAQYDLNPDHASFRTNEWGTRALRELCERNGLATEEYQRPWDEFSPDDGSLLCVFDPGFLLREQEVEALLQWVRGGGHLLVASDTDDIFGRNPSYHHISASHALLSHLGLRARRSAAASSPYRETVQVTLAKPSPIGHQVGELVVQSPHRLAISKSPDDLERQWRRLVKDDRELPTIAPLEVDEYLPLLADDAGVLLMRLKVGTGMINVLSDADVLGNGQIGQADNAILAMNLIYARGAPATVYFDEYHHGRVARPFAGQRLPGASLFAAIWALLLCLAIYLSGSFWRFGRPVPLPPEPRRSLTEHIRAFAGLYRGAQASGAAVTTIARRFESHLAGLTGLSSAAPADELARAVARTADIDAAALSQLLNELRSVDPDTRLPEARMLSLARRIAYFEEALPDGKSPGSNL